MKPWVALIPGEVLVEEPDELLWRQVHPTWVTEDGVPTSQAFKPATADEDKPSVARSSVHTAGEAYRWHTETAKRKSVVTWGVAVGECVQETLRVVDDSNAEDAPPTRSPAHAYLDFRSHMKGEVKLASAALLAAALRRGQIYAPST